MTNAIQETGRLGQSIWYDNVRRGLIVSGDLERLIDSGVSGLTSNPSIFEKAIAGSADYDDALRALADQGATVDETYEALTIDDIRMVADLLRPLYDRTGGADGYASLEVSPDLAHDTEASIEEARRLFKMLERPNAMIKIPATPEGMPAVRQLISEGINVNVTLIFSLAAYRQVIESYLAGLEQLAESGGDVSRVASVASFFLSRVDTAVDAQLQERIDAGADDLEPLLGRAAIANAQKAYGIFKDIFESERFAHLRKRSRPGCSAPSGPAPAPRTPPTTSSITSSPSSGRTPSTPCRRTPSPPCSKRGSPRRASPATSPTPTTSSTASRRPAWTWTPSPTSSLPTA